MVSFSSDHLSAVNSFIELIPKLTKEADYAEMYGFDFSDPESYSRAHQRIIDYYLTVNKYNVEAASKQFYEALIWRKEFNPLSAACIEVHDERSASHIRMIKNKGRIYIWNKFEMFLDIKLRNELVAGSRLHEYVRWRIGMLEAAIAMANLDGQDRIPIDQIYDFSNVSGRVAVTFGSDTKKATKIFLNLVRNYYPGIIDMRYFVNTPFLLAWLMIFGQRRQGNEALSRFVTVKGRKVPLKIGTWVPKAYGGEGPPTAEVDCQSEAHENARLVLNRLNIMPRDSDLSLKVDSSAKSIVSTASLSASEILRLNRVAQQDAQVTEDESSIVAGEFSDASSPATSTTADVAIKQPIMFQPARLVAKSIDLSEGKNPAPESE